MEEIFGKQKANIKWLVERDKNTRFFHRRVQKRKQSLLLFKLKDKGGNWITNKDEIGKITIHAFMTQLNGDQSLDAESLL